MHPAVACCCRSTSRPAPCPRRMTPAGPASASTRSAGRYRSPIPAPSGPATRGRTASPVTSFCTTEHHGGTDQAVYAYAREDLDWWERELGYELPAGQFGENLTTQGLDLTGTLVGERWRIGGTVVLQATSPRIPCATFAHRMSEPKWVKRFTARGATGTYLRVVVPGEITAGDRIEVIRRPQHTVTIGRTFRALTTEAELLPSLLQAGDDLPRRSAQPSCAAPADSGRARPDPPPPRPARRSPRPRHPSLQLTAAIARTLTAVRRSSSGLHDALAECSRSDIMGGCCATYCCATPFGTSVLSPRQDVVR